MQRSATFSDCGCYRYVLRRTWDRTLPAVLFVALNPSTADGVSDDPTVRRCITFARSWGFGKLVIANLFSRRSTDPTSLADAVDPIGPKNDWWLSTLSRHATVTIAAWGVHGSLLGRDEEVIPRLKNVHHLGRTREGYPRHPLYLPGNVKPVLLDSVGISPHAGAKVLRRPG